MIKQENFKPTWIDSLLTIGLIVFITWLICCCQWVDNQLEALECWPEEIGNIVCEDRVFYVCPLSLRWERLGNCEDMLEYNLYFNCCKEEIE